MTRLLILLLLAALAVGGCDPKFSVQRAEEHSICMDGWQYRSFYTYQGNYIPVLRLGPDGKPIPCESAK